MKKIFWPMIVVIIVLGILIFWSVSPNLTMQNNPLPRSATTITTSNATSSSASSAKLPLFMTYVTTQSEPLLLIDANGRKAGKDPTTGKIYNDIPGTSYQALQDDTLSFLNPTAGTYTIETESNAAGKYSFEVYFSNGAQPAIPEVVSGTAEANMMVVLRQNYIPGNFASSTISQD
jgi:hypothetical protein